MAASRVATIRQCVILAGGLASRLGVLAAETPKPVLDVGGRPFVAWLMREMIRFGVDRFVFLTGHLPDAVEHAVRAAAATLPSPVSITFSVEPHRAGTGGALWHAAPHLHERFLLCNGDSLLDCNLALLLADAAMDGEDLQARIIAHPVADASRYGTVAMQGDRVCGFDERPGPAAPATSGVINAGIYAISRRVLDRLSPDCSLERDLFSPLAHAGSMRATLVNGWFIDIGVPADLDRARIELARRLRRPALFINSDCLFSQDHRAHQWCWIEGIQRELVRATTMGWHVFAIGTDTTVEQGRSDVDHRLQQFGQAADMLRHAGGTLDDGRAGIDPDAAITALAAAWELDLSQCWCLGFDQADLADARVAGIAGGRCNNTDRERDVRLLGAHLDHVQHGSPGRS